MLRFRSLASGSSGNATLVEAFDGLHRTRVLLDCGLGLRQLEQRLASSGLTAAELDGIFITHEHGDHIGCALAVAARHGTPLWMSAGTWAGLAQRNAPPPARFALDGQTLVIKGLQIQPFTVPHDTREPLQLVCSNGDRRLGLLTDLGHPTAHALAHLAGCHALMLESNHCPDLLARSHYPAFLKRRVGGTHGHLSNAQASMALAALRHDGLRTVIGAHLSEHNNRPELVRSSFAAVLGCSEQDVLISSRRGLDWLGV